MNIFILAVTSLVTTIVPSSWDSNVRVNFCVVDGTGVAVSNAVITICTQRDRLSNLGHSGTPLRKVVATTDANGRVSTEFQCFSGEFSCCAEADGFYSEEKKNLKFKYANSSVYFAHLLEHEKSIVFTLRPIIKPIPCFGYGAGDWIKFPLKSGRFGFDMKKGALLPPYGIGEIADFWVRREETNGICKAILEFDGPFNGVYKQSQELSTTFKSAYNVNTNLVFAKMINLWERSRLGNETVRTKYVSDCEYLVIRSRSTVGNDGRLKECNYSKIYGEITASESLRFMTMVFNPNVNDTNLEFDRKKNLRRKVIGVLLP